MFIAPDILGGFLCRQGANGKGAIQVGEAKGVVAYGFVQVCSGLLAPSDGEIVELDIFERVYFIEGICGWSRLDPVADLMVRAEGADFGFLPLSLFELLLGLPVSLGLPGFLFFVG